MKNTATVKRLFALFLALSMLFVLAACGPSESTDDAKNNDSTDELRENAVGSSVESQNVNVAEERYPSVVIGITQSIDALDPSNPSGGCRSAIGPNIYETLFDFDATTKEIFPVLVESYEEVDDMHIVLHLYDYIVDSAGNNIKAQDVVFCYQQGIDGFIKSVKSYVDSDGITALDDYTVEFALKAPLSGVGDFLTLFTNVWIYSQAAFEASEDGFATDPIATGPYVVTDFVAGYSCTMEANDNYWQKDELTSQQRKRNVQTIQFNTISSSSQMVVALQTDKIDYASSISMDDASKFASGGEYAGQFRLDAFQDNKWYNLIPNCSENSLLADKNLRLAIYYAIDTTELAAALPSDASPMVNLCNSNCEEWDSSLNETASYMNTYDLDLAKQYLAESSYDGSTLRFLVENDENITTAAQVIQMYLEQLGIEVEFLMYDNATTKEMKVLDDVWDLAIEDRAGGDYAVRALKMEFDKNFQPTSMFVDSDDTLTDLFEKCLAVETHSAETWADFQNYVLEQGYMLPLYSVYNYSVCSNDFSGICRNYKLYILPGACTYVTE